MEAEQSKQYPNPFLCEKLSEETSRLTEEQKKRVEQRIRQFRAAYYNKEGRAYRSQGRRDEWIGHKVTNILGEGLNKKNSKEASILKQSKFIGDSDNFYV